jgi:hypothetical protein
MMVDGSGTVLARQPNPDGMVGRQYKDHPMMQAMLGQPGGNVTGELADGTRRIFGYVQPPAPARALRSVSTRARCCAG